VCVHVHVRVHAHGCVCACARVCGVCVCVCVCEFEYVCIVNAIAWNVDCSTFLLFIASHPSDAVLDKLVYQHGKVSHHYLIIW